MNETKSATNPPKPTDRLQALPTFMQRQILAFFGYRDYTLTGRTCQYLHALWKEAVGNNQLPLFVPTDCETLKEAVETVAREAAVAMAEMLLLIYRLAETPVALAVQMGLETAMAMAELGVLSEIHLPAAPVGEVDDLTLETGGTEATLEVLAT